MLFMFILLQTTCSNNDIVLQKYWKVKSIMINDEEKIDFYSLRSFTFLKDNKLLLPKHKNFVSNPPLKYCFWEVGAEKNILTIHDLVQKKFSGNYKIETISHTNPLIIKLTSDSIKFILEQPEGFSLNKPLINH